MARRRSALNPFVLAFICGIFFGLYGAHGYLANADTATSTTDLQAQIDQSNQQISQLKDEIAKLQSQLVTTSKQKQTLQNAIAALNLNIQKLQKSIVLTQTQMGQKDREIQKLSGTIATTTEGIETSKTEVAASLRILNSADAQPLLITFLSGGSLADFFNQAATLANLRSELENHITDLANLKASLEVSKSSAEDRRLELAVLNQSLGQQKTGLAISRDTQTKLLQDTKSQESAYQAQIAQKKALEAKFEQDLTDFESQLKAVSAGSVTKAGSGVLAWPVDDPMITQYFGNTDFSTANPQVYNGHGHNAIDLRASPGTPIKAARAGTVRGTGNTDLTCPRASYGKWIFIDHDNGLSTIYAHLSTILVTQGETVEQGQVIGYSDTTGYATGPHLHFGVYVTSGSEIASFPSKSCSGKIYTMPVAPLSAYLNPLSYLPPIN